MVFDPQTLVNVSQAPVQKFALIEPTSAVRTGTGLLVPPGCGSCIGPGGENLPARVAQDNRTPPDPPPAAVGCHRGDGGRLARNLRLAHASRPPHSPHPARAIAPRSAPAPPAPTPPHQRRSRARSSRLDLLDPGSPRASDMQWAPGVTRGTSPRAESSPPARRGNRRVGPGRAIHPRIRPRSLWRSGYPRGGP